jgi:hypothetical protein
MPVTQDQYEQITAIVTNVTLIKSVEYAWPDMPPGERDALVIGVIDRMARMRGWAVRREFVLSEEEE